MGLVVSCKSGVPVELKGFKEGDKILVVYTRRDGKNSVKIHFYADKHIEITRGDRDGKSTRQA